MNPEDNTALEAVAEAAEAAIVLAGMAGMDLVSGSPEIRLRFADSGDITVSAFVDDEEVDSGVVASSDIETFLSADEGAEPSEPAPPSAQ